MSDAPRDDRVYLGHILDAIQNIEEYLRGLTYDDFARHKMARSAVIRELQIIGEATKRLSASLRADEREIPWKDIVGMRDKLVHDYFGIDFFAVWQTATNDLTPFKETVRRIFKILGRNAAD